MTDKVKVNVDSSLSWISLVLLCLFLVGCCRECSCAGGFHALGKAARDTKDGFDGAKP